ncbi:MAG: hypothetical protein NZ524_02990 [Thiobacillaceae bacterium]|nr:hypothetical protein [Thiobacillaceae bacterium]MCX7673447.1 hypothetical protein [Thiobacillaceae bacterium]MDW8323283.1 DUF4124 domain-containing protein [Burkholderiales bacterium]
MRACLVLVGAALWSAGIGVQAEGLYKCREGGRIVYQSLPCPPGAQALPVRPPATAPEAEDTARAQKQARAEIAAAEALRRREREAEAERVRQARAAAEEEARCARRLEVIRMLEREAVKGKRKERRALQERKEYILHCGPLPD